MKHKCGFPWLRTVFLILATVIPLAILIVPRFVIERNLKTMLSAEEYRLLERYRNEPFHLDPKWKNTGSDPEGIDALREELFDSIPEMNFPKEINDWVTNPSVSIGDEIWVEVGESFNEDVQDSLTQIENILNRSGFTYDRLNSDLDKNKLLGGLARSLLVRSRWHLERGDTDSAINDWFLAMRLSRRNSHAKVMQQMMADGIVSMNLKHFSALVEPIEDGGQAREVLAELIEMRPMVCNDYFEDPIRVLVLDLAGLTEEKGGAFVFLDGEPARESTRQIWSPSSPVYKSQPGGSGFLGNTVKRITMSDNLLTRFWQLHDMMSAISLQNMMAIKQNERIFQARFDLACLYLANRIREMEGRDPATQVSDLVPEFFEDAPLDPFTGEGFLWSTKNLEFYSVGPDGDDDQMGLEHPMDGTENPDGDVSLP